METAPATEAARQWQGWGTALKPALEPIVLARKPLTGTVAANVLQHGTGALNIDASRIAGEKTPAPVGQFRGSDVGATGLRGVRDGSSDNLGRWPANVIHDGSEEVTGAFPETSPSTTSVRDPNGSMGYHGGASGLPGVVGGHNDSGSAARFFYSAKADAADRCGSKHPTVKPVDLMAYLVRLVTPPGGTTLDPFAGSGSTGMACLREGFDCILIEREAQYVADIHRRLAHVEGADTPLFASAMELDL
jgi:site-specific DNA-methyltransferase (adenine-specific)